MKRISQSSKLIMSVLGAAVSITSSVASALADDEAAMLERLQSAEVGWACGFDEDCRAEVQRIYEEHNVEQLFTGDRSIILKPAPGSGICALIPVCSEDLLREGREHNFSDILSVEIGSDPGMPAVEN